MQQDAFLKGAKDAVPIGLGYFAVSFSLGIAAANAGLSPWQSFVSAISHNASAGQYAGYQLIAARAAFWEIIIVTFIANARYALMSSALTQKLAPQTNNWHRFLMAFGVTDEIFALSISQTGFLNPYYTYGLMTTALLPWAVGTTLGAFAGQILPLAAVSALSVALYGMFIAIVIPVTRNNRVVKRLVIASYLLSLIVNLLPALAFIPAGIKIIGLTIIISTFAAFKYPIKLTNLMVQEGQRAESLSKNQSVTIKQKKVAGEA